VVDTGACHNLMGIFLTTPQVSYTKR